MSDEKRTVHELDDDELAGAGAATRVGSEEPNKTAPTLLGVELTDEDDGVLAEALPTRQENAGSELEQRILERMERKSSAARIRIDPLIGKVFGGRFEITSRIGMGGMGVVYKARQKGMDRFVAIKVLLKQYLTNETVIKRFHREALAVSKLEHPNTVRIYDFGETDDGTLYIAMEFLGGASLEHIVRREQTMPVRRVLRVIRQICLSLEEAHDKGIIHRDLKPDNVFVGALEGQPDFVKVLDFGVAKLREGAEGGTLTQHGTIFGTPKYMSPEQCRSQEVAPTSDLYSVGVIMYEMLSGRVPFESDNPLAILIMHAQDRVAPMAEVRPDLVIPFEAEELLHSLLAKNPGERPQTARDVVTHCDMLLQMLPDEFEHVLTHEDAERAGMDVKSSRAFTVPDNATAQSAARLTHVLRDESDNRTVAGERLPALPTPRWKKALYAGLALLVVAGGAAGWVASRIQALPEDARRVIPKEWASAALPVLEPDLVTVAASANVGGVVVRTSDGQVRQIEAPDKPITFQWLRDTGAHVTFRFERVGAAPVVRTASLAEDGTLEPAVFTVADAKTVTLTVTTNVGEALVYIQGVAAPFAMPGGDGQTTRTIVLPKGDTPLTVTLKKTGYKEQTARFVPARDGGISVTLEAEASATVSMTLETNVGEALVYVQGHPAPYAMPAGEAPSRTIAIARGDQPVEIQVKKTGFLPVTQRFTPSADGSLKIALAPDPNAAEAAPDKVTITLRVNARRAEAWLKGSQNVLRLSKAGQPGTLEVPRGAEAVEIQVEAPGYKPHTERVVPDQDREVAVTLQRRPAGSKPPDGRIPHIKTIPPKPKPPGIRLDRIKGIR